MFELDVDLQLARGFRRDVLVHLREIPYGATASYAVVARATGHPRAVRAVGTACAHNPVPLVVPCHRVVRSDGTIGQYRGGVAAKRAPARPRGRRLTSIGLGGQEGGESIASWPERPGVAGHVGPRVAAPGEAGGHRGDRPAVRS